MNQLEYDAPELKNFEKEIYASGLCKGLAKTIFWNGKCIWDYSHCINIIDYCESCIGVSVTDRSCKVLSFIRKIIESKLMAEDYLILENRISYKPQLLWIDINDGIVKLLPDNNPESFIDSILMLTKQINADDIGERIKYEYKNSSMTEKDLLRFLSLWELELKQ